jgi:hypothetical protein
MLRQIGLTLGTLASIFLILFPHSVHLKVFGPASLPHPVHVLSGIVIGFFTLYMSS